jgi:hypothetical protein
MKHPDPLIMSADIARVASERPELGKELVQALYQHLVLIEGRQPAIDELREYVDRLSSLDEVALRRRLGLGTPRRKRPPALARSKTSREKSDHPVERAAAANLKGGAGAATPQGLRDGESTPVKRRGRRPLTEDRVRADLERALAQLAERGIVRPSSWEQVASEHEGLTEFGMSMDMLKIRRDRFPAPFRELVPHLAE